MVYGVVLLYFTFVLSKDPTRNMNTVEMTIP